MGTVMGTTSNSNVIDVEVYARGENGIGIKESEINYCLSDSGTSAPETGWQTEVPNPQDGKYLWTRVKSIYTNDTYVTSYSVSYYAINGTDGGYYVPTVAANGDLSWEPTDSGMSPVTTVNIKGPKGDTGEVKYKYTGSALPSSNIEYDTIYLIDAAAPTSFKHYDEYVYVTSEGTTTTPPYTGWEKFGEDMTNYATQAYVAAQLAQFTPTKVQAVAAAPDTSYSMTAVAGTGSQDLIQTEIRYYKQNNKNFMTIDNEQVTTGLFYAID